MKSSIIQNAIEMKFRRQPNLQVQRGASLLEGIAYLGIAAIVVLGAVSLLTGAFSSAKSNQTQEELIALRTAARKLYIGQIYSANMQTEMASARAIPATIVNSGTGAGLKNSWGGDITIVATGGGSSFTVTYNAVPSDVCTSTISGMGGWTSINGQDTSTTPLTTTQAATICGNAGAVVLTLIGT